MGDSCAMKKQGCDIEAIGINYSIYTRKGKGENSCNQEKGPRIRHVLKDVNCRAKPWEILAIVGPSGAGKSSLLEILAGKLKPRTASIYVNKKPVDEARLKKLSGYVPQKDTLFPLLTVEETLMFSAKLRLGIVDGSELRSKVKLLIQELGLDHVAGARVGDYDKVRGISGGERRRVSIGVEVIHDPRLLILDEPTSGLDSTSALQIIDMLKTMAETRGRTIVLTIHQPGFRIIKLFNSILLLANASVLHHGTVDQLGVRLRLMNLQIPLHVNIVEFAIDSIPTILLQHHSTPNVDDNNDDDDAHHTCTITTTTPQCKFTLQQLFLQQSKVIDEETIMLDEEFDYDMLPRGFANSRLRETIILTHRFSKNIFRTKELFACRTIQMLAAGLVLGSIFYNLKDNLVGAEERVGLFAFVLTFLLSSTIEALPIFLQEREILMKETSCGSYRVSSYAIANALVYLPFLLILALLFTLPLYWLVGLNPNITAFIHFLVLIWLILNIANSVVVCFSALVPNFIVGNSLISGVMGSFFLFSGYFVSKNEMPNYWIFMHYISLFKYPFEGMLINEFSGSNKCFDYMFGACVVSGEDVLKDQGYGEESRWRNMGVMVGFIFIYRFISYVILRCRCCH